ncbi:MAG: hypothetical protein Q8L47_00050 [bacterium]|nr:hypothetical protein [bacterium]
MRPSSQRAISFILSLAMLIGAVIIYSILIVPSYEQVQQLRSQDALKTIEFKEQEKAAADLEALLSNPDYSDLKTLQESLSLTLPNDPNIAQIVSTLNGLAIINTITIKNLDVQINPLQSLGNPSYVKNVGSAKAHFQALGTYEDFKSFIGHLENNVRLMDAGVVGLTIEKSTAGANAQINKSTKNYLSINVDLQAYYQEGGSSDINSTSTKN